MKLKTIVKASILAAGAAAAAPLIKKKLDTPQGKQFLYEAADKTAAGILTGVAAILPTDKPGDILDFTSTPEFPGTQEFIDTPADGAKWSLGFAKASILPENVYDDVYYLGGYLAYPPNRVDGVLDDQMIRVFALDDGSGRGKAVFAVIDCVGISNHDVNEIRSLVRDFAQENNIVSINVSATHSHSCIDTLGIWGELTTALKTNPVKVLSGENDFVSGRNEAFMQNLKETAARLVREAVSDMKPGKLFAGLRDASQYCRDKRPPEVTMGEMTTLLFRPDDSSAPTRAVFFAAHPTQFGEKNKIVSGDFPYYLCERAEEDGENAIYFQGAQLAVATERGKGNTPEGLSRNESIRAYGRALAEYSAGTELAELPPMLNIRHKKILLPLSNKIFLLLERLHVIDHDAVICSGKNDMMLVSEIGFAQLGGDIRIAMLPGETAPELVIGGCAGAQESYSGEAWGYPSLEEIVGGKLAVIGLCNDEIGYIVPDNDFGSIAAPLHYEESVSLGKNTASKLVKEFGAMMNKL
ncbi:MAG: hypothetical protein IK118_02110 [Clostridia bacterium]|nr:hypothetical protein [Clostridia bacterium]